MDNKKRSEKDIQKENEELKSRISQEFGGMSGGDSELPSELENQFLKNVLAFEEQFAQGKDTTVYDRIGRPDWKPADDLDGQNIEKELHHLHSLLHENGISIDTICEVEDHVLYRFITEELFNQEIMDIAVPGMMTCFIYEEFHPNHEYDSEQSAHDFIYHILLKNADTEDWYFNENLKVSLSPEIDSEKAIRKVKNFINSWTDVAIQHFKTTSVSVTDDDQEAMVTFEIAYDATMEGSSKKVSFEGNGKIKLENVFKRLECAGWDVLECEIPGFEL